MRLSTFVVVVISATTTWAQVNETLSTDSTIWYNQTLQLEEVVIKSSLPKTRAKGDAMRTTVAGSILEKAGTVSDMLNKVPMLEAERDGVVKVVGRGDAEVYINGRQG